MLKSNHTLRRKNWGKAGSAYKYWASGKVLEWVKIDTRIKMPVFWEKNKNVNILLIKIYIRMQKLG